MKRTIKLVAVFMIIATLALSLVSCGKMLSGTYTYVLTEENKTTYEFSGNKFTRTVTIGGFGFEKSTSVEGTYKIEEDQDKADALVIILTYEKDGEETSETHSFVEGEENGTKYIKIDGYQFNKVK
ncbi:MAG: hypothetical protein ACI3XL_02935 [Eubacteriales bacterium]